MVNIHINPILFKKFPIGPPQRLPRNNFPKHTTPREKNREVEGGKRIQHKLKEVLTQERRKKGKKILIIVGIDRKHPRGTNES